MTIEIFIVISLIVFVIAFLNQQQPEPGKYYFDSADGVTKFYPLPELNLDKFGLPADYATYEWILYKSVVEDNSPLRRAFLQKPKSGLPLYDVFLMDYEYK